MNVRVLSILLLSVVFGVPHVEASITIDAYTFDLAQFTGAAVTYRTGGSVDFDGKDWDNHVGVHPFTLGELASGQAGGDPGDQVTLQNRTSPDWLKLTYAGAGLQIAPGSDTFVVYEITSYTATQAAGGIDPEALSWRIRFNDSPTIYEASAGVPKYLEYPSSSAEDVYQLAFDLTSFGLNPGDFLKSIYIENKDTGSNTSDPDFIFAGLEGTQSVVPEVSSIATWTVLGLAISGWAYRKRQNG